MARPPLRPVDAELFRSLFEGAPGRVWRSRMASAGLLGDPGPDASVAGSLPHRLMVLQAGLRNLDRVEARHEDLHMDRPVQLEWPRPGFWLGFLLFALACFRLFEWSTAASLVGGAMVLTVLAVVARNYKAELERREDARSRSLADLTEARDSLARAARELVTSASEHPDALAMLLQLDGVELELELSLPD